jgi:hypothetical protein
VKERSHGPDAAPGDDFGKDTTPSTGARAPVPGRTLSPAAERALAEAAQRRAAIDARAAQIARAKEHQGRGGLEPVRYDDWEVKGLASDF